MISFPKKIMSVTEICDYMGCSRKTLYAIIRTGGRCAWLSPGGGKYSVDTDALAEILRRQEAAPRMRARPRRRMPAGVTCAKLMAEMPDVAGCGGTQTADPDAAAAF